MKFPQTSSFLNLTATRLLTVMFVMTAMAIGGLAQRSAKASAFAPLAIGIAIEQCANGPQDMPIPCNTSGSGQGYARGNVNEQKAHYVEGQSVPIRFIATELTAGTSYTVTLGYDYTKSGKYAVDYLTTYNRTESVNNNPCVDVVGCTLGSATTFPIPLDPEVAAGFDEISGNADDITQIPGVFTCFGCTITAVSGYTRSGDQSGDSSKTFTITFTANQANIVIAYGAHISTRVDWGITNSAINITGSPYHNFVDDFPGANGGSRDLQLAASAVIFPAQVTVVKLVNNLDGTHSSTFVFSFSNTDHRFDADGSFTLVDSDPTATGGGSVTVNSIINFGAANSMTITESQILGSPPRYSLTSLACVEAAGGIPAVTNTTTNFAARTATIVPDEGEFITCTFTNGENVITAAPANVSGRVLNAGGNGIPRAIVTILDTATNEMRMTRTDMRGQYTFEGLQSGSFYAISVNAKGYTFASNTQFFTLNDNLSDVDFVANP